MKILPPHPRRSPASSKTTSRVGRRRRGVKPSKSKPAPPPALFVRTRGEYGGSAYLPARIKLKRNGYRYLVWTEGGRRREFYLGKVKILAPSDRVDRARLASSPAAAIELHRGGKK